MGQVSYRFLLILQLFLGTSTSLGSKNCEYQSNCGVVLDIKPPFRFKDDSRDCGNPSFELSCQNNRTLLGYSSDTLFVESIDYQKRRIHTSFTGLFKGNCSSFPKSSYDYGPSIRLLSILTYSPVFILICRSPVRSPYYVDTAPCITAKDFPNSFVYSGEENLYSYAVIGTGLVASDIEDSCTVIYKWILTPMMFVFNSSNISFVDIHDQLASGIDLTYVLPRTNIISVFLGVLTSGIVFGILGRTLIGTIVFMIFIIYKCKRRHRSEYDNIEQFLKGPNNLLPIRYSYKEIKQMTNNFRDKLGKGGYGDVYKGKSRSGYLVAVKMLSEAKGSGQDFINEVATIGRIYHLNVVRLVGFCISSSKRALVYDYMPNGSLDKFIFSSSSSSSSEHPNGSLAVPLSWERTLEIAVGVARGISYLHHGCHMQILHFDIKPHNILLDDNFVPKVSDFGLAKLCPRQKTAVTLTAAKGTLGYMAPELMYRKIGEVSHKADVYSFGQLLMAMVGRKKVNSVTEHSSRVYFPAWIYDRIERGEEEEDMDLDLGVLTKEEKEIVRKIILVGLCCVQWIPADRPSMKEAVEMLEGDVEGLKLPSKPLYYFIPEQEICDFDDSEDSTSALYDSTVSQTEINYASYVSH